MHMYQISWKKTLDDKDERSVFSLITVRRQSKLRKWLLLMILLLISKVFGIGLIRKKSQLLFLMTLLMSRLHKVILDLHSVHTPNHQLGNNNTSATSQLICRIMFWVMIITHLMKTKLFNLLFFAYCDPISLRKLLMMPIKWKQWMKKFMLLKIMILGD